jgi:hypothetical protein
LGHGRSIITDFHRVTGDMDSLLLSGLIDADGNGVVNASDLNHANGANAIDFSVMGADLLMRVDSFGAHLPMRTETIIQGGAGYYNLNNAGTLAGLLGSGALLIDPIASVTIPPANDAPTWTGTGSPVSLMEQTATTLNGRGMAFADADAGSSLMQLTITGQDQDVLGFTAGSSGVTTVSGEGSSSLVLSGTLAQLNALLASDGEVNGAINYSTLAYTAETAEGRAASELSFTINDLGGNGDGEGLSATQTLAVEITADTAPIDAWASLADVVAGGLGNDYIDASESSGLSIYGGSGDDVLRGDFSFGLAMHGGTGNDVLDAGRFRTYIVLEGGAGNDQFRFGSGSDPFAPTSSTVTDFHREVGNMDVIVLSDLVDTNDDGQITAADLNLVAGPNYIDISVSGADLFINAFRLFGGEASQSVTIVTGGASYFTGNSADTLTSLLGSGALVLEMGQPMPLA